MKRQAKRPNRGWKWAFTLLLLLNVGIIIALASLLTPATDGVREKTIVSRDTQTNDGEDLLQATVTLGEEDLESLLQDSLSQSSSAESLPDINIAGDAILTGELSVFGFSLAYQIEAEPFADADGNLQLKVGKVGIEALSLPTGQVLRLLAIHLDPELPLQVDPDKLIMTVLLSEIQTGAIRRIELVKIEKDTSEYTFIITMPKENLLQW